MLCCAVLCCAVLQLAWELLRVLLAPQCLTIVHDCSYVAVGSDEEEDEYAQQR